MADFSILAYRPLEWMPVEGSAITVSGDNCETVVTQYFHAEKAISGRCSFLVASWNTSQPKTSVHSKNDPYKPFLLN